jgi:hypothetical protein
MQKSKTKIFFQIEQKFLSVSRFEFKLDPSNFKSVVGKDAHVRPLVLLLRREKPTALVKQTVAAAHANLPALTTVVKAQQRMNTRNRSGLYYSLRQKKKKKKKKKKQNKTKQETTTIPKTHSPD